MYLYKKWAVRKTASLERHSLSLALRKQCKCTEAGSKIRGKYVCVSFPHEKHVSCGCPFPTEKNERTTRVEEGIMIRKERERHMKKQNHLMLAPLRNHPRICYSIIHRFFLPLLSPFRQLSYICCSPFVPWLFLSFVFGFTLKSIRITLGWFRGHQGHFGRLWGRLG